jgi:uncharacterized protein YndB with AHSA1/START domain
MQTTAETMSIEREIAIAARPETVWELLVDPDKAARWMGMSVALDPRPGGHYRVEVLPGELACGEFVVVDPPRRLVWTWGWDPTSSSKVAPGSTTIEVELVATEGGTTLRFRHHGFPDADAAQSHAHGWDHYLGRLAVAAAGGDPGTDPWLHRES